MELMVVPASERPRHSLASQTSTGSTNLAARIGGSFSAATGPTRKNDEILIFRLKRTGKKGASRSLRFVVEMIRRNGGGMGDADAYELRIR
jgi:hypothetical protein